MTDPVTGDETGALQGTGPSAAAARLLARALGALPEAGGPLGIALSGGGDSMALLHLMAEWAGPRGIALAAATVDHGLRAESADEAVLAARACAALGVSHDTLHWRPDGAGAATDGRGGWDGRGNLSDAARRARYALLADWARGRGLRAVMLAHTLDDQAETVLLRLARGSGVDGLSGMAARRAAGGMVWARPLLGVRREALREVLRKRGAVWAEDPTNADPAYARVRARRALAVLAPLGVSAEGLSQTAERMAMARDALARTAHDLAARIARIEAGDVVFDAAGLAQAPEELRLRLIAQALRWVASADYRPRLKALKAALAAVEAGRRRTLAGCTLTPARGTLRIGRELRALAGLRAPSDALWDGRWRLSGPYSNRMEVRALGMAGLAACPSWRATGLPRATLAATPAVWQGETLVAAPLAGRPEGWSAQLADGGDGFLQFILSH